MQKTPNSKADPKFQIMQPNRKSTNSSEPATNSRRLATKAGRKQTQNSQSQLHSPRTSAQQREMSNEIAQSDESNGEASAARREGERDTSLVGLINDGDWAQVRSRIESHPEEVVGFVDRQSGWTILHDLCHKPPTPQDIFRSVVELYPEAVKVQENNYKATPLHVLCWSSQRSISKVKILLEYLSPEDMLVRNRFGGTVLHSAAGSHAWLPVLKVLVEKNPAIVMERTHEYNHTALTALWQSHLQSIPGHMQIARILEGDEVDEGHFHRFWEKVVFLAQESFTLSPDYPSNTDPDSTDYVFHGLLNLRAPLNALKVALRRHPKWATHPDARGNYPLHHVVIRRPFRVKDKQLISELIRAYPEAAGKKNKDGDTPIFIAIRDRMSWEEGLGEIVNANTDVLANIDPGSGLYPFLLCASLGGKVAVNTTYQLLCAKPYLVKDAITSNE